MSQYNATRGFLRRTRPVWHSVAQKQFFERIFRNVQDDKAHFHESILDFFLIIDQTVNAGLTSAQINNFRASAEWESARSVDLSLLKRAAL